MVMGCCAEKEDEMYLLQQCHHISFLKQHEVNICLCEILISITKISYPSVLSKRKEKIKRWQMNESDSIMDIHL